MTNKSKTNAIVFLLVICSLYGCSPVKRDNHTLTGFNLNYTSSIKTISSSEIEKSPWGIHFNGMPFHDLTFAQYDSLDVKKLLSELPILIQKTNELGLKWARISVDWGLIEDNQGVFHWELLDPMINGLVDAGIEVYPSLHAGHRVHTNNQPPKSEAEITAWLNFTEKIITRYAEKITYWEIWNEPNTTWFWGGAPKASEYVELVKRTAQQIRALDPESKVIGGSLARLDVPYADTLFQLGIADDIDIFSFHPYGIFPEAALKKMDVQVRMPLLYEPVMNPVQGLIDLIAQSGKDIKLWQGECGYPSAMNGGGWNGTGPFSEEIQAKWILRRAFTDLSFDAEVSAYFLLKENKHPHYDFYNYKGLLKFHDLSPKIGFQVFQNLSSIMHGDFERVSNINCKFEILEHGQLHGIRPKNLKSVAFKKGDSHLIAYWGMTHLQSDVQPGTINMEITGLNQVQSVELVDFYSGEIYTVTQTDQSNSSINLSGLPMCDYPYLLRIQ